MRLHNQIRSEAVTIAGPDYAQLHCSPGFEAFASIAEQYNEPGVLGDGLKDIYYAAGFMAEDTGEVAACAPCRLNSVLL
jgi:hypothetical protein